MMSHPARTLPLVSAATRRHVVTLRATCANVVLAGALISGCSDGDSARSTPEVVASDAPVSHTASDASVLGFEPLDPISTDAFDPTLVALGEALFHDKRLSADDTVACASCHDLARGGVDGRQFSVGIRGQVGSINAPTVFNAALGFAQFWNGRAATLEAQAAGPPQAPAEMGSSWSEIVGKLNADEAMRARFQALFADGVTAANVQSAIATFERTLITPNAPFDRYLRGDESAMSLEAKKGFRLFADYGCVACHQGRALGGNMYQRFGVMGDYFADHRRAGEPVHEADLGRFAVTGKPEDRHVFKVPGLRNVARTAPYFHDGSAATLPEAVRIMAQYQLGRRLSDDDNAALVAFLEALTGEYRGKQL